MEYFKEVLLPTIVFGILLVLAILLMCVIIHITGIDMPVRFLFIIGFIFAMPKILDLYENYLKNK